MKRLLRISFFVSLCAFAGVAAAASRTWDGGAPNGIASDARNWDGDLLPSSGDALNFPSGYNAIWDLNGVTPLGVASAGELDLQIPLVVTGDLNITGGTLSSNSNALTMGGSVVISGGNLSAASSAITVSGNWTFAGGSANVAASTITFTGGNNKTITSLGKHFGSVLVNSAGATVELVDAGAVDNMLTVGNGTLTLGTNKLTVSGGIKVSGGTLALADGTLVLSGSLGKPLDIVSGSMTAGSNSTVEYRPVTGTVSVTSATYGNLTLTGSGVFTLIGDTVVTGTLTIGSNAILSQGGRTLHVTSGKIMNNGTLDTDGKIVSPALSVRVTDPNLVDITSITTSSRTVNIRVEDHNRNLKASATDTASGIVITTISGDRETFAAPETTLNSGIFMSGAVVVHQGTTAQGNGQIEVTQSDIIFVTYTDPGDSNDTKTTQLTVQLSGAIAPGVPQIVSGPRVTNFSTQSTGSGFTHTAHFVWETDQVSSSSVSVTSALQTAPLTAGSLNGVTTHDVAVSGLKRGTTYTYTVSSTTADGKSVTGASKTFVVIVGGDRIKSSVSPAVYWYLNEKRNVFPDFTTYDSWFTDFNGIVTVPQGQLADTPLGKNVPVRAGTYLIKIQSDPKVYIVEPVGVLRWLPTEARATALYGSAWNTRVRDTDVSLFASYTQGKDLGANEVPDNFFYQIGMTGEWSVYAGNVARVITDTARTVNAVQQRFVSSVIPATIAGLVTGASYFGHAPDIMGVLVDGGIRVIAPGF